MKKAVLYARVSTKEQAEEGYSLPSQVKLLKEYALSRGFEVVKIFDVPESARGKQERTTFKAMLEFLRKESIDILLCEKVDRLTRNFSDAVVINDWLEENSQRQIHFVKQSLVIHKESKSNERFQWDIHIVMARNYVNNLAEEVKKGQREKLLQGWLPTKPPLGYMSFGEKGQKKHKPDESVAPFIIQMFQLYATGNYSVKSLRQIMHQNGLRSRSGKPVAKSTLHRILTDPFYCGRIRWNNEIYGGQHQPLITEELFNQVQTILQGKTTPKLSKYYHKFKGLIKCASCGGTITWEIQKSHWYGHCNHYRDCPKKKYIREESLDKQLAGLIGSINLNNPKISDWIKLALKESHQQEISFHDTAVANLTGQYQRMQTRLDKLYDDKLEGNISEEFYGRKFHQYTEEQEEVLRNMNRHKQGNKQYFELGTTILEVASRASKIYETKSDEKKRALLNLVFSNLRLDGENLLWEYTKPFALIAKGLETNSWLTITDDFRTLDWASLAISSSLAVVLE